MDSAIVPYFASTAEQDTERIDVEDFEDREEKEKMRFRIALESLWADNPELLTKPESMRMKDLLVTEQLADTTFLVGVDKVPVRAHRFVLFDKSEFFSTLFSSRWTKSGNKSGIEIPELEPEEFTSFLEVSIN
jgi:hypothetical protein